MSAVPVRFIRMAELRSTVGLSKSTIYDEIKAGRFPAPVKLTAQCVAWRSNEIFQWIESRTRAK